MYDLIAFAAFRATMLHRPSSAGLTPQAEEGPGVTTVRRAANIDPHALTQLSQRAEGWELEGC